MNIRKKKKKKMKEFYEKIKQKQFPFGTQRNEYGDAILKRKIFNPAFCSFSIRKSL
jgi:hypothetical protein